MVHHFCTYFRDHYSKGYTDVRDIIADDDALQAGALPALREYNLAQFITADVPACEQQVCFVSLRL